MRHHIASLIVLGILHSESPRDHRHLGLCLWERHVGLKTPQNVKKECAAIPHSRVRALAERRVYVGFATYAKSVGSDPDDGVRFSLQNKPLPDRFFASAKAALPQTVADDRDRYCAGLVLLRQKCTTFD